MRDWRLALFIAGYWFIGGYAATWFTPYALQAALIALMIGLVILLMNRSYEDRRGWIHPLLGCSLFAPPLTLMVAGAAWLFLEIVGLV